MATGAETAHFDVRAGSPVDAAVVLGLFDDAVRWMATRGMVEQWGDQPFSADPRRVAAAETWASGGGLWICERDEAAVGLRCQGGVRRLR